MPEFSDEAAFFDTWKRGVSLAGVRWFGDGQTPLKQHHKQMGPGAESGRHRAAHRNAVVG